MEYIAEINLERFEYEHTVTQYIFETEEFKKLFPDFNRYDLNPLDEEQDKLNRFITLHYSLYSRIKGKIEVEIALTTLERRCALEIGKRFNFSIPTDYIDTEDVINICSDDELNVLFNLIKKINMKIPQRSF